MRKEALTVPPRSVFAGVLLWSAGEAARGDRPNWPTVVDLTNKIVELKKDKDVRLNTKDISIRADLNGWISDDLSSFVDRFVLFGFANENPIKLSSEALELCRKILREDAQDEEYRSSVQQLDRVLTLGLGPATAAVRA